MSFNIAIPLSLFVWWYLGRKTKIPSLSFLLGQEKPAVPPGLAYLVRPLMHTAICSPLITERRAPSYILGKVAFPFALGSPFSAIFSAAITPPAALCGKRENAYLLSLNGLGYFITRRLSCQVLLPIFCQINSLSCRSTLKNRFSQRITGQKAHFFASKHKILSFWRLILKKDLNLCF